MGNVTGQLLKLKLRPTALPPITATGYLVDVTGVAAIIFQNTGTTNCRIFNGMWTVLADGGTLALNVTEDLGSIDILNLTVEFVGAGTNRLEVLTLRQGNDNSKIAC
jgi:hypothetical protein